MSQCSFIGCAAGLLVSFTSALAQQSIADATATPFDSPQTTAAALQASGLPETDAVTSLDERLARALQVKSAQAVPIVVDNRPGQAITVAIPINGVEYLLDLRLHSVRSPIFQVLVHRPDDTLEPVAPPTECTLRGEIRGLPGSIVAGGILEEGLYATIIMPEGDRWWIQPAESLVDDPELVTSDHAPGPMVRTHALFRAEPTHAIECTTVDEPASSTGVVPTHSNRGPGTRRVATLAIDAEWAFFLKTGSINRTTSMLATIINIMNVQYEREVDIRHDISTVIVRTFQVYSIGDPNISLLNQFQARWNANHTNVVRDVAMLIDGNGNGGQAKANSVCTITNAYAGCGMDLTNIGYRCDCAAHELGHAWGACHCPCATPGFTMNWQLTYANRFFQSPGSDCGPDTLSQILAYRDSHSCFTFEGSTPVPNDNCANAVDIPCGIDDPWDGCSFGINNIEATLDGPTADCTTSMRTDIWYRWVPRCDASVTINTCVDASFDTMIAVYSGGCPTSNATMIACNDDNGPTCAGLRASLAFQAVGGTAYYIRIGGFNGAWGGGIFEIRKTFACSRPFNDSCGSPQSVNAGQTYNVNTRGAFTGQWVQTSPINIPRDSWTEFLCSGSDDSQLRNDVWFRFVAPCTGAHRFSLCGSNFDTKLALYLACPTINDQAIACNDDSGPACGGLSSSIDYNLVAGSAYIVRVGGYGGQTGDALLRIDSTGCVPAPANDSCSAAIAVGVGTTPFSTAGATAGGGDACHGGSFGGDIWYRYTPTLAGTATVALCNTNYFERLVIYPANAGCSNVGPGWPTLACGGAVCDNIPSFTTIPGASYLICVSGGNLQTGSGNLIITFTPNQNGACCRGGAQCTLTSFGICVINLAGTFSGNGTTCAPNRCCRADVNASGTLTVQDLFDFLAFYFSGNSLGDFNGSGTHSVQDIFDYLAAYFTGCA